MLIIQAVLVNTAVAATFTVNQTADTQDVSPGDGLCADASGDCTVRAALEEANGLAGTDDIDIPAGVYTLSPYISADFEITESVNVTGAGQGVTVIESTGYWTLLNVTATATGVTLTSLSLDGTGSPLYYGYAGVLTTRARSTSTTSRSPAAGWTTRPPPTTADRTRAASTTPGP